MLYQQQQQHHRGQPPRVSELKWRNYLILSQKFSQAHEDARHPPHLLFFLYMHLTAESLRVCFVIIRRQMTSWAAAALKWNVCVFKAAGGAGTDPADFSQGRGSLERVKKTHAGAHPHTHA